MTTEVTCKCPFYTLENSCCLQEEKMCQEHENKKENNEKEPVIQLNRWQLSTPTRFNVIKALATK